MAKGESDPVSALVALLDVERLDADLFRGDGHGGETSRRIFGGQVVAQALAAASHTVEDRPCHSLHAYFLRPGDPSRPVIYAVDRARDGGSFTTRRVTALQEGRQILNLAASFHAPEGGPGHQHEMPEAEGPEGLTPRDEIRRAIADRVPEPRRRDFLRPSPIEVREPDPQDLFAPEVRSDRNALWFRIGPDLPAGTPDAVKRCLLAYASDANLLGAALRPQGRSYLSPDRMMASLDHAIWFHAAPEPGEWLLYAMDSPFSGGGRAFTRGSIFDRSGRLIASTAQEGLVREITPKG